MIYLDNVATTKMDSDITSEKGVLFHADAVQTFGHIPMDVKNVT